MVSQSTEGSNTGTRDDVPLVDCDLHVSTQNDEELRERLPEPFRSKGINTPGGEYASPIGVARDDAVPDEEGWAGSDPELTRKQLLDPLPIEHAIITSGVATGVTAHPDSRHASELARAYNDWVIEKWTSFDDRIHASIAVAPHAPEEAAEEIHRLGDHPDMVQVIVGSGTRSPIGRQEYWPIYEAATEEDLPVAMHIGPKAGQGISHPNNPGGPSRTYGEAHAAQAINYYGQLASLVLEGAFEEFPDLRFVMVEGEFGWVPDLMWRMDRNWEKLQSEVPWLEKPPSEYVREQARFTTQPTPEPPNEQHLYQLLEMAHAEDTLMFCSDYPHWDGDYSLRHIFPRLSDEAKQAIFSENAKELYCF